MKEILMPDEYIPDYTLTQEEEQKRFDKYMEKVEKGFKELENAKAEVENTIS